MIALFLLLGFGLLLLGGELLVRGGVGLALKYKVPKVVIGLTLVAFATSAPELLVSLMAALKGKSDIALGNVIGSNIANVGLILGLIALLFKMSAVRLHYRKDWIFLMVANLLLGIFLFLGGINWIGAVVFIAMLVIYNIVKINYALKHREDHIGEELEGAPLSPFKGVLLLLSGTVALKYGAELFVSGISSTALALGLSERFVALTMVAFGTSVPELAASFIAARKGEADIAIGNIIGSNIFNILSVLGFAALVQPIELIDRNLLHVDFAVSFFLSLLIIPLMGLFKADRLDRLEGALLLGIYIVYIVALVFQG